MDLKELERAVAALLREYAPNTPVAVDWDGTAGILCAIEGELGPTIVLYVDGPRKPPAV
jgi:hypothetical protein